MSNFQNLPQNLLEDGEDVLAGIERKLEKLVHNVGIVLTGDECVVLKSVLKSVNDNKKKEASSVTQVGVKTVEIVVQSATPGFCYLKLMLCLPSIGSADEDLLKELIVGLKSVLGKNPQGKSVLVHLTMSESILSGSFNVSSITTDDPLLLMESNQHLRTLGRMMESRCCFTYEEVGGVFHIREVSANCSCNEILCEHGWAARFMLQVITRDSCIVGADVDFSALFVEASQDHVKGAMDGQEVPDIKVKNSMPTREELQGNLEKDMVTMLSVTLDNRTNLLEQALKEMLNSKGKPGPSDSSEFDSEPEETILPSDSSTQFGRYGKKFMNSGTVYNVRRAGTRLDRIGEDQLLTTATPEVIQGFVRTERMTESERASLSQIYSINGLAAPFKCSRLNFLTHFHTALSESKVDSKSDPMEAMEFIAELKPRNPTEELMKQVVIRTFDFDQMVIIANPFKLPFIEIGMILSDSSLAKCFEFLRSEYRTLWFNEMKCLHVPQFHREFRQLSTSLGTAKVHGLSSRVSRVVETPAVSNTSRDRQASSSSASRGRSSSSQKNQSLLGFKF